MEWLTNLSGWLYNFYKSTIANPEVWGILLASPVIAIGIAGTILPILPGTVMIMAGFIIYGLIAGFEGMGFYFFIGQTALIGLSYLVDFIATALGVKMYGGSKAAIWGAVAGTLLIFVIGPVGLLIGPLIGAILGELLMGKKLRRSMRAGFGSFLGLVGGSLAKLVISCFMVGWFLVAVF
jgi:hypothetical protein